jgi:hypothetical protein
VQATSEAEQAPLRLDHFLSLVRALLPRAIEDFPSLLAFYKVIIPDCIYDQPEI